MLTTRFFHQIYHATPSDPWHQEHELTTTLSVPLK